MAEEWLSEDQLHKIYKVREKLFKKYGSTQQNIDTMDSILINLLRSKFLADDPDIQRQLDEWEEQGVKPTYRLSTLLHTMQPRVVKKKEQVTWQTPFEQLGELEQMQVESAQEAAKVTADTVVGGLRKGVETYGKVREKLVETGETVGKKAIITTRKAGTLPPPELIAALATHQEYKLSDYELSKIKKAEAKVKKEYQFGELPGDLPKAGVSKYELVPYPEGKKEVSKIIKPKLSAVDFLWQYMYDRQNKGIDAESDKRMLRLLAEEGMIPEPMDLIDALGTDQAVNIMRSLSKIDPRMMMGKHLSERAEWLRGLRQGLQDAIDEKLGAEYAKALSTLDIPGAKKAGNDPKRMLQVLDAAIRDTERADPSWQWRGEIRNIIPRDMIQKYPRLASALDTALMELGREYIQELYDPNEWLFDAAIGMFTTSVILLPGIGPVLALPVSKVLKDATQKGGKIIGKLTVKVPKGVTDPKAWFRKYIKVKGHDEILDQSLSLINKQDDEVIADIIDTKGIKKEDLSKEPIKPVTSAVKGNQYVVKSKIPETGIEKGETVTLFDTIEIEEAGKKGKAYILIRENGEAVVTRIIDDERAFMDTYLVATEPADVIVPEQEPTTMPPEEQIAEPEVAPEAPVAEQAPEEAVTPSPEVAPEAPMVEQAPEEAVTPSPEVAPEAPVAEQAPEEAVTPSPEVAPEAPMVEQIPEEQPATAPEEPVALAPEEAPAYLMRVDEYIRKDLPREIRELYTHPIRTSELPLSAQRENVIASYLKKLRNVVEKYDPNLLSNVAQTEIAFAKNDYDDLSKNIEYVLSSLHKPFYDAKIDATGLALEHRNIVREAINKGLISSHPDYPELKPKIEVLPQPEPVIDAINNKIMELIRSRFPDKLEAYATLSQTQSDYFYRLVFNDIKAFLEDPNYRDDIIRAFDLVEIVTPADGKTSYDAELYDIIDDELELIKHRKKLYIWEVVRPAYQTLTGDIVRGKVSVINPKTKMRSKVVQPVEQAEAPARQRADVIPIVTTPTEETKMYKRGADILYKLVGIKKKIIPEDPLKLSEPYEQFIKRNMTIDQWERIKNSTRELWDFLTSGMNITIQRKLRREHPLLWSKYRTHVLAMVSRGLEQSATMFADILGPLNKRQRKWWTELVALKHLRFATLQNGIAPGGFTLEQIDADLDKIMNFLNAQRQDGSLYPERQAVIEAENKFVEWSNHLAALLVQRGKLQATRMIATVRPFEYDAHGNLLVDAKTKEPISATGELIPYKIIETASPENYYLRELVRDYARLSFHGIAAIPYIPRRGHKAFEPWLFKRRGTTRDILLDAESLMNAYAEVFASLEYDTFIQDWLPKWDRLAKMTPEEARAFRAQHGNPKPGNIYELADPDNPGEIKKYWGWQVDPSLNLFVADTFDFEALVQALLDCISETCSASDIQKKVGTGDIEQVRVMLTKILDTGDVNALDNFLRQFSSGDRAAVSRVLAIGRRNRVMLFDETIKDTLQNLVDQGNIGPFMAHVARFNRWYKRIILRLFPFGAVGLPYHIVNMMGDIYNAGRVLEFDALKWFSTPMPELTTYRDLAGNVIELKTPPLWIIIKALFREGFGESIPDWYKKGAALESQDNFLGKAMAIIKDGDVISAGITGEVAKRGRVLKSGNIVRDFVLMLDSSYWQLSAIRESLSRVTIVLDLLEKHIKGQLDAGSGTQSGLRSRWLKLQRLWHRDSNVLAPELVDIDVMKLYQQSPADAIALVAREVPVDSMQVNYAFRRYFRGFLMPFGTWPVMNTLMWMRYVWEMPGGAAIKFALPEVIMRLANYRQDYEEVRRSLSERDRARPHIILSGKNDRGLARVMFLDFPLNNALGMLGLNMIGYDFWDAADKIRQGADIDDTARWLAKKISRTMIDAGLESAARMTPLVRIVVGALRNYDIVTRGEIMPVDPETGDFNYISKEFAIWLASNLQPQIGAAAPAIEDPTGNIGDIVRNRYGALEAFGIKTIDVERGLIRTMTKQARVLEVELENYYRDIESGAIQHRVTEEELNDPKVQKLTNIVMEYARSILEKDGMPRVAEADMVQYGEDGDLTTVFTRRNATKIAAYILSDDYRNKTANIVAKGINPGIRGGKVSLPEIAMIDRYLSSYNFLCRMMQQEYKVESNKMLNNPDMIDSARQKRDNLTRNEIIKNMLRVTPTADEFIRRQPKQIEKILKEHNILVKPVGETIEAHPKPEYNPGLFDNVLTIYR